MNPALEASLLQELRKAWHSCNILYFHGSLKAPVLALGDAASRLGAWEAERRCLTISLRLVREHPWGVVVEVLKHEMAHQYAHEVLGARGETAHGPAFQHVCNRLGIDAASGGLPPGSADVDEAQARVVRRIQKLLALAGSPNANEAQAATNAARRLMLEHNLSAPAAQSWRFLHLGRVCQRIAEHERSLANLLATHFFVEAIWAPSYDAERGASGRVLEVCGTPGNLELAAYVYDFLQQTGARLWEAHRQERGGGERDRQRFLAGVMRGFSDKLLLGAEQCREEGLVWVGDPGAKAYVRARYPRTRQVRYGGNERDETWHDGHAAGHQIVLHKPVKGEGSGGTKGLLRG